MGASGQVRSPQCPICGAENGGKWTCARCTPLIALYREAIRNLQPWLSAVENSEAPDLLEVEGRALSVWDITTLYDARVKLAPGLATAIELCLYRGLTEREAAQEMGISGNTPVAIYAKVGITRLLGMSYRGEIGGVRVELPQEGSEP